MTKLAGRGGLREIQEFIFRAAADTERERERERARAVQNQERNRDNLWPLAGLQPRVSLLMADGESLAVKGQSQNRWLVPSCGGCCHWHPTCTAGLCLRVEESFMDGSGVWS
ncbi:hypothetical protein Mp_2g13790 [Marchantia polymorpha subsp. ruderalis]|uniref:Uncharacterized protein n=1 Tax=Marchantia polymorpha TaxID=3197 RepID=A0A2R6X1G4_MARPO|nr:hypothetical protein MARPO_0042s0008 [Marchantia polymorpha]BBN02237.1 hypothetical protein Mp_2g13790 [Marchantia polymorpha subsp. ruderalis]|eukprot:PTQ39938.1 hypothetical protein MARPO_0042s0008 [Marchantia polymorpha]